MAEYNGPRKPILSFKDMLAMDRTKLAKKRNNLAKVNTNLAIERTVLAKERTLLANERTLLAYVRTSLTILAAAVTLIQFFENKAFVKIGWIFIPLGLILLAIGTYRYFSSNKVINLIYKTESDIPTHSEVANELKND